MAKQSAPMAISVPQDPANGYGNAAPVDAQPQSTPDAPQITTPAVFTEDSDAPANFKMDPGGVNVMSAPADAVQTFNMPVQSPDESMGGQDQVPDVVSMRQPQDLLPQMSNFEGMIQPGNIMQPAKSVAVGVGDNRTALVPAFDNDGNERTQDNAIKHFQQTGQTFGVFSNIDDAQDYQRFMNKHLV